MYIAIFTRTKHDSRPPVDADNAFQSWVVHTVHVVRHYTVCVQSN